MVSQPVSQGAPSPFLSSSSVPTPRHPHHPPTPLRWLTMVLPVHRPHVSEPLFKTQVLPTRHYSRKSEGTMKDRVEAAIQELWKEEEEGQA